MNDYEKMKLAEKYDEDCEGLEEICARLDEERAPRDAEAFKRKYKEFYSDIKLSHREDW